jgi:hypothetical protein
MGRRVSSVRGLRSGSKLTFDSSPLLYHAVPVPKPIYLFFRRGRILLQQETYHWHAVAIVELQVWDRRVDVSHCRGWSSSGRESSSLWTQEGSRLLNSSQSRHTTSIEGPKLPRHVYNPHRALPTHEMTIVGQQWRGRQERTTTARIWKQQLGSYTYTCLMWKVLCLRDATQTVRAVEVECAPTV